MTAREAAAVAKDVRDAEAKSDKDWAVAHFEETIRNIDLGIKLYADGGQTCYSFTFRGYKESSDSRLEILRQMVDKDLEARGFQTVRTMNDVHLCIRISW